MPLPLPKLNDDLPPFRAVLGEKSWFEVSHFDNEQWYSLPTPKRLLASELAAISAREGSDWKPIPGARPGLERNSKGQLRYLSPVSTEVYISPLFQIDLDALCRAWAAHEAKRNG